MQLPMGGYHGYASGYKCDFLTIQVHQADRMWVGLLTPNGLGYNGCARALSGQTGWTG